jgi:hypothetical protein
VIPRIVGAGEITSSTGPLRVILEVAAIAIESGNRHGDGGQADAASREVGRRIAVEGYQLLPC